jgi:YVTN family beta-propeller protein
MRVMRDQVFPMCGVGHLALQGLLLACVFGSATLVLGQTKTIAVGQTPWSMGANPTTARIYVGNLNDGTVSVIDAVTKSVIATVPIRPNPFHLAVDTSKNFIYVTSYTSSSVDLLDGPSNTVPNVIPGVGDVPVAVAMNPITQRLYVALHNDKAIRVVDVGGFPFSFVETIPTGRIPSSIAVNTTTNRIYVALSTGRLVAIEGATNKEIAAVTVGTSIYAITLNAANNLIYAVADGLLKVIEEKTVAGEVRLSVIKNIPVGHFPLRVAFNSMTKSIFVTNYDDDTVSVIDGNTYNNIATVPVGHQPSAVAVMESTGFVNAAENRVFVANSADNTVSSFIDPAVGADLIIVPVRWCAIEGSDAAAKMPVPSGQMWVQGNSTTDLILLDLLRSASDKIWMASARIAFRSANAQHLPIIADPSPPVDRRQELGDIEIGLARTEQREAVQRCSAAWADLYPEQRGIIAVNVRQYIDSILTLGQSPAPDLSLWVNGVRGADLCAWPRHLLVSDVTPEWLTVKDQRMQTLFGNALAFETLAHELGHCLLLGHGNGLDDNHDGGLPPLPGPRRYDQYCDRLGENEDTTTGASCDDFLSLMTSGAPCSNLRPLQIEAARDAAVLIPGAISKLPDPAGEWVLDVPCQHLPCGIPADLQVVKVGVSQTPGQGSTELSLQILGPLPDDARNEYLLLVDLDAFLQTGCSPSQLGFPTKFRGADLVASVTIRPGARGRQVSSKAWTCRSGRFQKIAEKETMAAAFNQTVSRSRSGANTGFSLISLVLSRAVEIKELSKVRIQGYARHSGTDAKIYRFPTSLSGAGLISLIPPVLPQCTATPLVVNPGAKVAVEADGLLPYQTVDMYLGDQQLASPAADSRGMVRIDWTMPHDAKPGQRLLSLVTRGTAVTAACSIAVIGEPPPVIGRLF